MVGSEAGSTCGQSMVCGAARACVRNVWQSWSEGCRVGLAVVDVPQAPGPIKDPATRHADWSCQCCRGYALRVCNLCQAVVLTVMNWSCQGITIQYCRDVADRDELIKPRSRYIAKLVPVHSRQLLVMASQRASWSHAGIWEASWRMLKFPSTRNCLQITKFCGNLARRLPAGAPILFMANCNRQQCCSWYSQLVTPWDCVTGLGAHRNTNRHYLINKGEQSIIMEGRKVFAEISNICILL